MRYNHYLFPQAKIKVKITPFNSPQPGCGIRIPFWVMITERQRTRKIAVFKRRAWRRPAARQPGGPARAAALIHLVWDLIDRLVIRHYTQSRCVPLDSPINHRLPLFSITLLTCPLFIASLVNLGTPFQAWSTAALLFWIKTTFGSISPRYRMQRGKEARRFLLKSNWKLAAQGVSIHGDLNPLLD